eukprot:PhM_4_TR1156/c0_g1_i1/m.11357
MQVGWRVRIHSLQSIPQLNGTVGVILSPEDDKEAADLTQKGRYKVSSYPTTLALKPTNLTPIDEDDEKDRFVDWSFVEEPKMGIKEICTDTVLRNFDKSQELVSAIATAVTQTEDGVPQLPNVAFVSSRTEHFLPGLGKQEVSVEGEDEHQFEAKDDDVPRSILNNTMTHCVYLIQMHALNTSVVIESFFGLSRMFMCSEKVCTASEWCAAVPKEAWSEPFRSHHARFGGGRAFQRSETASLLAKLFTLQCVSTALAKSFVTSLPPPAQVAEEQWAKQLVTLVQRRSESEMGISPVMMMTQKMLGMPASTSCTIDEANGIRLHTTEMAQAMGVAAFDVSASAETSTAFLTMYRELIGCDPSATVLLCLLHNVHWRELANGGMPVGWVMSALTIPH